MQRITVTVLFTDQRWPWRWLQSWMPVPVPGLAPDWLWLRACHFARPCGGGSSYKLRVGMISTSWHFVGIAGLIIFKGCVWLGLWVWAIVVIVRWAARVGFSAGWPESWVVQCWGSSLDVWASLWPRGCHLCRMARSYVIYILVSLTVLGKWSLVDVFYEERSLFHQHFCPLYIN